MKSCAHNMGRQKQNQRKTTKASHNDGKKSNIQHGELVGVDTKPISELHAHVKWLKKNGGNATLTLDTNEDPPIGSDRWSCRVLLILDDKEYRALGQGSKVESKASACLELLK